MQSPAAGTHARGRVRQKSHKCAELLSAGTLRRASLPPASTMQQRSTCEFWLTIQYMGPLVVMAAASHLDDWASPASCFWVCISWPCFCMSCPAVLQRVSLPPHVSVCITHCFLRCCRAEPGWYNSGYIFPEGFASRVNFRSSVVLDALCVHECAILGPGGPVLARAHLPRHPPWTAPTSRCSPSPAPAAGAG